MAQTMIINITEMTKRWMGDMPRKRLEVGEVGLVPSTD